MNLNTKKIFYIILIISFLFITIYNFLPKNIYWDEGIYVSNGEKIFFDRSYEYESFRPPVLSLILGFFSFIGLSSLIFGKLLIILSFIISMFLIYNISEKLYKNSGIISTLLFSSFYILMNISNRLFSSILGIMFVLLSFNYFLKNKNYLAGLFLGIAFLTRFTTGLVLVFYGLFYFINFLKSKQFKINLIKFIKLFLGFLTLLAPYLLINKLYFGGFLKPIMIGQYMMSISPVTETGLLFFFLLLLDNLLVIFSLLYFLYIFKIFKTKKIISLKIVLLFVISLLYFIYFINLHHFESRYILVAIPFFVLISSFVIFEFLKNSKFKKLFINLLIILLVLKFIVIGSFLILNNSYNSELREYHTYFKNYDDLDLLIDTPVINIFTKSNTEYFIHPKNAYFKLNNQNYDFVTFNSEIIKDHIEYEDEGIKYKDLVLDILNTNYTLKEKYILTNKELYIYKLNNTSE